MLYLYHHFHPVISCPPTCERPLCVDATNYLPQPNLVERANSLGLKLIAKFKKTVPVVSTSVSSIESNVLPSDSIIDHKSSEEVFVAPNMSLSSADSSESMEAAIRELNKKSR